MPPEAFDKLFLPQVNVRAGYLPGNLREGFKREVVRSLDQCCVPHERHPDKLSANLTASAVEDATVKGALKAVVAHHACHEDGLHGVCARQKAEDFALALIRQGFH